MPANLLKLLLLLAALSPAVGAAAAVQTPVDRADPSVVEEELRDPKQRASQPTGQAPLLAQPEDDPDAASLTRPVAVRMVRVEGATVLPASVFAPAVRPFIGRTFASRDLRALATSVADAVRSAGYGLATAWIPEQTVEDGVLRVTVDEGRIDDVKINGPPSAAVRRRLAPLASGRPVRTSDLERRLLLAGDVSGVTLGNARLERVHGKNLLVVDAEHAAAQGKVTLDNWGSETVGPIRAHLSVDLNGVIADDDRVTIAGVATPADPTEFGLVRLGYTKQIGGDGTEVSLSGYAARSRPGGELADRKFEGRSLEASIGISRAFRRARDASVWGDAEFTFRDADQSLRDVTIRSDRLAILKAGSYVAAQLAGGRARARLSISQGLGILGATGADDPLRSRADGSAIFSKAEFWTHYDRVLAGPVSIQLQGEGQIASRPLLSSEEMGLGGRHFLRGYDYREFSGDRGIAGSAELRLDLPPLALVQAAQLYGYADAGTVGNLEQGSGGGSLASAGGGVRAWLRGGLQAGIEIGVPLSHGADPDHDREPRISIVVATRW
jgi:hemolysin activation/secretion protein